MHPGSTAARRGLRHPGRSYPHHFRRTQAAPSGSTGPAGLRRPVDNGRDSPGKDPGNGRDEGRTDGRDTVKQVAGTRHPLPGCTA
ncbi:hypothetical protein GCM10010505_59390 [Kitasatospora aburaviensis]